MVSHACCILALMVVISIQTLMNYNAISTFYRHSFKTYALSISLQQLNSKHNQITITNQSQCAWNEYDIRFVRSNESEKFIHSIPPYLISFQGSGNTYTRLIVELITNYYTGSILRNDKFLIQAGYKGDANCDRSVILLKAHPNYVRQNWQEFLNGTTNKCERQQLIHDQYQNGTNKMSALILIRNPWDAFFSEFQRSVNKSINGHIHNLLISEFNRRGIDKSKQIIIGYAHQFIEMFKIYEKFKSLNRDVLLIQFENIENEIWRILEFIFTRKYLIQQNDIYRHKIDCIFNKNISIPLPRTQ
eukprot:144668_1